MRSPVSADALDPPSGRPLPSRSVSVEQSPASALTDLDRYRLPQPTTDHTVARRLPQLRTPSVAQGPCPERSPTWPRRTVVAWASPEPGGCSGEKVGGGARARPTEWTSTPGHRTRAAAMAVPVLQEPFAPATAGNPLRTVNPGVRREASQGFAAVSALVSPHKPV